MRHLGKLVCAAATAVALAVPGAAFGATTMANLVDGSVKTGSTTCTWTNATTNANPPSTVTVDRTTVSLSCDDGTPVTLNNNPVISFDDAAGTALTDAIDITATVIGVTCRYRATNLNLARGGTTRSYTGGPFTGTKVSGSFLCPATKTIDTATISFH